MTANLTRTTNRRRQLRFINKLTSDTDLEMIKTLQIPKVSPIQTSRILHYLKLSVCILLTNTAMFPPFILQQRTMLTSQASWSFGTSHCIPLWAVAFSRSTLVILPDILSCVTYLFLILDHFLQRSIRSEEVMNCKSDVRCHLCSYYSFSDDCHCPQYYPSKEKTLVMELVGRSRIFSLTHNRVYML